MTESDSFVNEVTEEVRRDKLYATLRRYGWMIAGALILIIGTAAANEWRKAHSRATAEAAGDALHTAFLETDPAARAGKLAAVATANPGAEALVRIAEAGSLQAAGKTDDAAKLLADVADAPSTPELYRSLAALQRVMLLGPKMDAGERQATLAALSADGTPFRPLALEQQALMHLEAGDKPAALKDLQAVLDTPGAPQQLQARVRQLIIAAGGSLPAAPMPAQAVSDG